jgi:hypothetical protein
MEIYMQQILSEKEIEDILVLHSEILEDGLILLDRQTQLENRRTDLLFVDKEGSILLIELKKGTIDPTHVEQIEDYILRMKKTYKKPFRAMLVGQQVSQNISEICLQKGIEWKEITVEHLFNYLKAQDSNLFNDLFILDKLNERASKIEGITFHEYIKATSPYGIPYSSYQFFKPIDASPELSDDPRRNMEVANSIFKHLLDATLEIPMFNDKVLFRRTTENPYWSSKAKGAWKGRVIPYELAIISTAERIPCRLYLGSIGYRGNKPIFTDETSRFAVFYVGTTKNEMMTQYGIHKYLRTDHDAICPYYELRFNSKGIPPSIQSNIFSTLEKYGYRVTEIDKSSNKLLWFGEVNLKAINISAQINNFLETMFALTILKAHFNTTKSYSFSFLAC